MIHIKSIYQHFKKKIELAEKYSSYDESECNLYQTWKPRKTNIAIKINQDNDNGNIATNEYCVKLNSKKSIDNKN